MFRLQNKGIYNEIFGNLYEYNIEILKLLINR
jgi:hypothetical protein